MGSILKELEESQPDLFTTKMAGVSYPLGFPILDQMLGCKYVYTNKDGSTRTRTQLGVPSGTFTMFLGASQSGKSTAAAQASWNIIEPFDECAEVYWDDGENATTYERYQGVTGAPLKDIEKRVKIIPSHMVSTYDQILEQIVQISKLKASHKKDYMYDTGEKDFWGNEIIMYKPTILVMDSLMKFTSDGEETDEISDAYSGGREAVARGKFMRNALSYMGQYNINVFPIHHWSKDMRNGFESKQKQLPHLPTGVWVSGGDKILLYSTSIILFTPKNDKSEKKTEDVNGYNGQPIDVLVSKSRSSAGGTIAHMEFVQEAGFDPRLTLMAFAKDKKLITGVNPKSRFASNPDVTFDTRKFVEEIGRNPEIVRTLYAECKPELSKLIPVMDVTSGDPIKGGQVKIDSRAMLREMYGEL